MNTAYCPSCHAAHEPGDQFCGHCGARTTGLINPPQNQSAANYGSATHQGGYAAAAQPTQPYSVPPSQPYTVPHTQPHTAHPGAGPMGSAYVNAPAGFSPVPPGFWIRFFAYFLDVLVLFVLRVILAMIGLKGDLANLSLTVAYFVGFWSATSSTPGKMMLGMKILDQNGNPLTFGRALLRYLGYFVSGLTLCIGFIMIGIDEQKRGLHDLIAKTRVVRKA